MIEFAAGKCVLMEMEMEMGDDLSVEVVASLLVFQLASVCGQLIAWQTPFDRAQSLKQWLD